MHPFTKKVLAKLHMRRPEFRQLRELVSKVPWKNAFEFPGVFKCWLHFKHHLIKERSRQFLNVRSQFAEAEDQLVFAGMFLWR